MNLIQIPENLRNLDQKSLFDLTESLYFVGDDQFVSCLAEELKFPTWIDQRVIIMYTIDYLEVKIKNKIELMPVNAHLTFFKRPSDDMIVCLAYPCSMLVHYEIYEKGVIELLPKVATDVRENVYNDSASQHCFKQWAKEKVSNRRSKIKALINGDK